MLQLAWRFLLFQKERALAQWYRARTADARGGTRKTLIVALARKLLLALWRFATTGGTPAGIGLRPAGTGGGEGPGKGNGAPAGLRAGASADGRAAAWGR